MAFLAKTRPLIERGEIKVWSTGLKSALPNNEGFFFFGPWNRRRNRYWEVYILIWNFRKTPWQLWYERSRVFHESFGLLGNQALFTGLFGFSGKIARWTASSCAVVFLQGPNYFWNTNFVLRQPRESINPVALLYGKYGLGWFREPEIKIKELNWNFNRAVIVKVVRVWPTINIVCVGDQK